MGKQSLSIWFQGIWVNVNCRSIWLLGCTGKENKLEQRSTAIKYSVVYRKQDGKGTEVKITKNESNTTA